MDENEREGADITAADMVSPLLEPSKIQQYFAGTTVFITGGTGFLGRLLIEKLLRTCHDLRRIYILMRPKNGKTCEERLAEYFDGPLYDRLKREIFPSIRKLSVIVGDAGLPNLGIKDQDLDIIAKQVNCIFHCAETVRFDETFREATYINVRGTKEVLKIAQTVKDLRSFVHVSSAYSFCLKREIYETFSEPTLTGDNLITLVNTLNDDMLAGIMPTIIGQWPNIYTYTKSVAEDVVRKESNNLPVAIVRPSMVISTVKEPVSGWINNFYGATGLFMGACLGYIRTMHCEATNMVDLVPADYVINCTIAAAWDIAMKKSLNLNNETAELDSEDYREIQEQNIPIYNYVSGPQKPITWGDCFHFGNRYLGTVPTTLQVWHYMFWFSVNKHMFLLYHYLLHVIPAYIVDFLASCTGRNPQLIKTYEKIGKMLSMVSYFSSQHWIFRNSNTQDLWNKLNSEDKKFYEFNMASVDWDLYFHTLARGARVYLLNDSFDTINEGRSKRFKLKIAHYALITVLFLVLLKLVMIVFL